MIQSVGRMVLDRQVKSKKKLTLIGDVKEIVKIPSFQIAVILALLEGVQYCLDTPLTLASGLQGVLVVALPIVRILKREVKD